MSPLANWAGLPREWIAESSADAAGASRVLSHIVVDAAVIAALVAVFTVVLIVFVPSGLGPQRM